MEGIKFVPQMIQFYWQKPPVGNVPSQPQTFSYQPYPVRNATNDNVETRQQQSPVVYAETTTQRYLLIKLYEKQCHHVANHEWIQTNAKFPSSLQQDSNSSGWLNYQRPFQWPKSIPDSRSARKSRWSEIC